MKYLQYCRKSTETEDRQILSLDSQTHEIERRQASDWRDLNVVDTIRESRSAKTPGRLGFGEMLKRIRRGEADGIVAWSPDRLARNSVDGGEIIYLLDIGVIKDLKFVTFNFENTPQGKFLLALFFSQSKLYVDSMSVDIKKGMREKARLGWRPSQPPLGYLTNPDDRTIIPDPGRFELVQRMWRLMLSGEHSPRSILDIATNKWGLRTKQRKRSGGTFVSLGTVYHLLGNIFYAGAFVWEGELLMGKHKPMVTLAEFDAVQKALGRPGRPRPKERNFAYTGLIRCASCGLAVTAEAKVNRYGQRYVYYHCTHRKRHSQCRERSLSAPRLEQIFSDALQRISLAPPMLAWLLERLQRAGARGERNLDAKRGSLDTAIASHEAQLDTLTSLRLRSMVSDEEFVAKRQQLTNTKLSLVQQRDALASATDWIEPARVFIMFCFRAADLFLRAPEAVRRLIMVTVGSNLSIGSKMLNVEAAKPFRLWTSPPSFSELCSFLEDVRTFSQEKHPDFTTIIENIREIEERMKRLDHDKAA